MMQGVIIFASMYIFIFGVVAWVPAAAGWVGTVSYLAAYLLLSIGKLKAANPIYHVLNVVGAAGLMYNAIMLRDFPNVIVNVAWAIIAAYALVVIRRKKRAGEEAKPRD